MQNCLFLINVLNQIWFTSDQAKEESKLVLFLIKWKGDESCHKDADVHQLHPQPTGGFHYRNTSATQCKSLWGLVDTTKWMLNTFINQTDAEISILIHFVVICWYIYLHNDQRQWAHIPQERRRWHSSSADKFFQRRRRRRPRISTWCCRFRLPWR